jgi:hypothetical protein
MKLLWICLALSTVAMIGCEDRDDRAAAFAGEWTLRAEFRCGDPGYSAYLGDMRMSVHVTRIDTSHVTLAMAPDCQPDFVVADDYTAAAPNAQACQIDVPTLGNRSLSIGEWQLAATDPATLLVNSSTYAVFPDPAMWTSLKGSVDGCSTMTLTGGMARPR